MADSVLEKPNRPARCGDQSISLPSVNQLIKLMSMAAFIRRVRVRKQGDGELNMCNCSCILQPKTCQGVTCTPTSQQNPIQKQQETVIT